MNVKPSWHWATSEGSREFDRIGDRNMTLLERFQWIESSTAVSRIFSDSASFASSRVCEEEPTHGESSSL